MAIELNRQGEAGQFRLGSVYAAAFPRFDVNPNTGEPLNDNRSSRCAANTV